jgi:hypothetical protein
MKNIEIGQIRETEDVGCGFKESMFIVVDLDPVVIKYLRSGVCATKFELDVKRYSNVIAETE